MIRRLLAVLLVLLPAVPALAKSDPDFFPIPCDVLWNAVKTTLNNPADYSVITINDLTLRASFDVVGDLTQFKDVVVLKSQEKGCSIKLTIIQVGSDNSDERGFRGRLKRTLAKMQRTTPLLAVSGDSTGATPAQTSAAPAPAPGAPAKPQSIARGGLGGIWKSTLISQIGYTSTETEVSTPGQPRVPAKPVEGGPSVGAGRM